MEMVKILCQKDLASVLMSLGVAKAIGEQKPLPEKPVVVKNTGTTEKPDFAYLWTTCAINDDKAMLVKSATEKITSGMQRYITVSAVTGVPWYVIGLIHKMESNCDFSRHLHNGDPLTARTVQVPKGRPVAGNPPFTWEQSAIDALGYDGATKQKNWDVVGILTFLEKFNGLGYRRKGIYSPYLWSYTNHYSKGKYVADGKWDAAAVSKQCGAAAILKHMSYGMAIG